MHIRAERPGAIRSGPMFQTFIRYSGLLLIGGAALLGVTIVMLSTLPVMNRAFSPRISLWLLLSAILLLLSLPGIYAKQANAAGWLGLGGHLLLHAGMVLLVLVAATPLLYPSFGEPLGESPVVFVLGISLTLGLLLSGVATIQAGIYPRWSGVLLLAATVGFFFDFFVAEFLPPVAGQIGSAVFGLLLALALVGIGYSTLTRPAV